MPNTQQTDDFDLASWLSKIESEGSLTQEEVKSLGTILGKDKVKSTLKDQFLMRQDYSRKTQEIADQRRQVEADVSEILKERADLATWKNGIDGQLKKAYADLDSTRSSEAQFRARIQTIAEQSGLDVNELLQGLPAAKAATDTAVTSVAAASGGVALDPRQFVSSEEYNRAVRQLPLINAQVADVFNDHLELTGKPLKIEYTDSNGMKWTGHTALLMKTSEHNNRPGNKPMSVRQVWETDFNIPQVRQQQLESSIEGRVREKLEAEYKTKLSADMLNGGAPGRTTPLADRPKSVLFDDKRDQRTPAEREVAPSPNGDNGSRNEPPPSSSAGRENRWQRAASGYVERRAAGIPLGQDAPAPGKGGI